MSKNTVTIPKTASAARKQIVQIDAAELAGKWHKAAICYAYRAKHYDTLGNTREAEQAAADELNMRGYGSQSIQYYARRWKNADLADIRPGDEFELPDLEWESITGGEVHPIKNVKPEHVEAVMEAAKADPAIADAVADAIVNEKVASDQIIDAGIEKHKKDMAKRRENESDLTKQLRETDERVNRARDLYDAMGDAKSALLVAAARADDYADQGVELDEDLMKLVLWEIRASLEVIEKILNRDKGWDDALAALLANTSDHDNA